MALPPPLSHDEIFASLDCAPRVLLREEKQGGVLLVFQVASRPGDTIEVCSEGAFHFMAGLEGSAYAYRDPFAEIVLREHALAIEREKWREMTTIIGY